MFKIKRFFNTIIKLIINTLLIFIGICLFNYLLIPSIFISIFIIFFKKSIKNKITSIAKYFKKIAISIDQLGNAVCADLFDIILIDKGGYRFGNPDETVSSVFGKNQKLKKLSNFGNIINWILNKIEKNHSLLSIEKDETNTNKK